MSEFTYEKETTGEALETFEWDNIWFEQTNLKNAGRVLYIGDSISCGIRNTATELSCGKYLFDGVGTSKGIDNPYFKDTISLFAKQEKMREIVLFNNGLHGFHLSVGEYEKHYEDMINFLLTEFPDTKIAVVLTTYIKQENERLEIVKARNEKAKAIAKKHNLPVIDLYSVSEVYADELCADGVHMTKNGYEKLAEAVLKRIDEI